MQFLSQKSADAFIRYCSEMILDENGYAPVRSYYCPACGCWHITSHVKSESRKPAEHHLSAEKRHRHKKLLDSVESRLKEAFRAVKWHEYRTSEQKCEECLSLLEECLTLRATNARLELMIRRLSYCLDLLSTQRREMTDRLFQISYEPCLVFHRQWYMCV